MDLAETAKALVAEGKGILAADESAPTIKKRFDSIGVESTVDVRHAYRQLLFTAPDIEKHISGVILFDETIRQSLDEKTSLSRFLARRGILPGIKVDRGTKSLAGAAGETITEGLDGLRERFEEYVSLGARFAKWRATILIGDKRPTDYALSVNANALARYAALAQEAGLVPIVEPEVLMDGEHTIHESFFATKRALMTLYDEMQKQGVRLEGTLLKPNMVLPGYSCPIQDSDDSIASHTLACLRQAVPAAVPGIVFLSGGQTDEQATARLNAMNAIGPHPWQLSFSYGRALQGPVLRAWAGKDENVQAAQEALAYRAHLNGMARSGSYTADMER